jgi:hypothetical protein
MQGIGSTIVSASKCERDCNNFSTGTQTDLKTMTKTLYASEEFPLLDVSSPEEEADFESISKPLINDETSFTYSKMLDVNITEKHPGIGRRVLVE